jgi:hypothetical protein
MIQSTPINLNFGYNYIDKKEIYREIKRIFDFIRNALKLFDSTKIKPFLV